jgi:hypothetical protein
MATFYFLVERNRIDKMYTIIKNYDKSFNGTRFVALRYRAEQRYVSV